ncbi:MAG TPA: glycosyltransferase family 2 protein [Candidatus Saccharimonadales bacterium]|nr:glycosyltransferase family 2 protein [Candidatus Saccharimonadales bacterium]
MKLVVQIPCLNEAETLPLVLKSIPKKIAGIDEIAVLVIDDGCTDNTVAVARAHGVEHFVHHPQRQGLARSFRDGLLRCLELGADVIVNTDGDNQYPQASIPELIRPIVRRQADIVIADRQVHRIAHFSRGKKILQRLGTRVLNAAAGTRVPDAPSGFRAYSRDAALRLNVVTRFSYAMETLIQAGNKGLAITSVPITVNPKTRESRLFRSSAEHVVKSGVAIARAFIMYRPYVLFASLGAALFVAGAVPFVRYLYFVVADTGRGHLQSLVLGSVLLIASFIACTLGIVADLIRINRVLIEDGLEQAKRTRYTQASKK